MSVKITELPFLNTLDDNDVLAGVDTSADTTSKVTVGTLKEYIDSNTTYTAGTNIDITNNVVSAPNVYTKSEVNGLLPTKVSDLTNDSGFITKAVNDLTNYYTSSNTYTKTEVNNLISQVNQFNVEIVQTLPSSNIDPHTIYFVAKTGSTGDVYDEYIYINNAWELIGSTDIDLTGYVKNTDYASSSTGGVFKTSNSFATDVSNGYLNAQGKTYTQYGSLNNNAFISKQTLENVITGKELTNADDLEELADDLSEDINYVGREVDSLSTVYNALPYASDDGTSITLNDTVETKFKKFDLKGNTYQFTTTGKNLFNIDSVYSIENAPSKSLALSAGTYKVSCKKVTKGGENNPYFRIGNTGTFLTSNMETTINLTEDVISCQFYSNGYSYAGSQGYTSVVEDFMVSISGGAYEPYTNGASPNPSYPQDVNVVSGDNEIEICGKNLFDKNTVVDGYLNADGTLYNTLNYRTSDYIRVQPNTAYYKTATASPRTKYYDKNKQPLNTTTYQDISIGGSAGTFTTPNNAYYLRISYKVEDIDVNTIQLEKGSTASTYEPYQGNTYNIDLPVENLIDMSTSTSGKYVKASDGTIGNSSNAIATDYIEVIEGQSYYFSGMTTLNNGNTGAMYNSNKEYVGSINDDSNIQPLTIPSNVKYIRLSIWKNNYSDTTNPKPQLEKGTKANSYTPYGTTPIELCKIGTYKDYFYRDNGNWYLHKEIGKYIPSSESSYSIASSSSTRIVYETPTISDIVTYTNGNITPSLISNRFTPVSYNANWQVGNISRWLNRRTIEFIVDTSIATVADFKNWVGNNYTEVYYVLATPTNTKITYQPLIDQLNELYIAKSKLGQTNISQVNNDLPFILDVEGAKLAGSGGGGGTSDYTDLTNKPSINSVTLSGNKSLSDLGIQPAGNYVTNTDYATSSTGGVVKTSNGFKLTNGQTTAEVYNYSQYQNNAYNDYFIGKGTLENVIAGKQLVDSSTLSNSFESYDEGIREFISAQIDSLASITNAFPTDRKEGNYMVLDETAKVRFKDVILKGNMSQASSPTPSNPVDVETVSGTYNISFIGKNKLQNNIQNETYKSLTITNNGDGSFSLNGTPTGSFGRNIATNLFLPAGTYTISANTIPSGFYVSLDGRSDTTLNSTTFSKTFTLNADTTISEVGTWITKDNTYNDTIFVQIERSDRQTDYEPYDKYTYYNFNLRDYSLCKIGNYQDEIYFDSGSWYASYATSSMYFDSSSGFVADWSSGNYYCYKKAGSTSYIVPNTFVSKYFADLTTADFTAKNKYGVYMDNTGIYIVTDISTLSSFNTWLDTNQPTVYFARKSRNTHEISDTTLLMNLNYLASSQACKGSTTIYAEGTNAPLIMEIEAVQDLSSVLDRLELLENSNNS